MSRRESIDGEVIRTTERAVLVRCPDKREVWVPRSVCLDGDMIEEGDTDLEVETWFAEKEGLA